MDGTAFRVPPRVHFCATCTEALGVSLRAFWILVANSWMRLIHTIRYLAILARGS
jgi:hypothetical protein